MNLGEILIEFGGDFSRLDMDIEAAKRRAIASAKEIEGILSKKISVTVDLSNLHELNKVLDSKITHIKQVRSEYKNPIKASILIDEQDVLKGIKELKKEIQGQKLAITLNSSSIVADIKNAIQESKVDASINVNNTHTTLSNDSEKITNGLKNVEKAVYNSSSKKGVVGTIATGVFEGLGSTIFKSISTGLKKDLNVDVNQIARPFTKFISKPLSKINPESIQNFEDAIVGALEDLVVFKNAESAKKKFQEAFKPAIEELTESVLEGMSGGLKVAAQPLRIRKRVLLAQSAQTAQEQAKNINISDEESEQISKAKSISLITGGIDYQQGGANTFFAENLVKRILPGSYSKPVTNPYSNDASNLGSIFNIMSKGGTRAPMPLDMLFHTNIEKGYNPDAVKMAAEAMAYRQKFPDKPIQLAGTSGGSYVVEEAIGILERAGIKNVKGIGITAPVNNLMPVASTENYQANVGEFDPLNIAMFGKRYVQNQDHIAYKKTLEELPVPLMLTGLLKKSDHTNVIPGAGIGHALLPFLAEPEFQKNIASFLGANINTINPEFSGQKGIANLDFLRIRNDERHTIPRTLAAVFKDPRTLKQIEQHGFGGAEGYTFAVPQKPEWRRDNDLASARKTLVKKGKRTTGEANQEFEEYSKFLESLQSGIEEFLDSGAKVKTKLLAVLNEAVSFYPELKQIQERVIGIAEEYSRLTDLNKIPKTQDTRSAKERYKDIQRQQRIEGQFPEGFNFSAKIKAEAPKPLEIPLAIAQPKELVEEIVSSTNKALEQVQSKQIQEIKKESESLSAKTNQSDVSKNKALITDRVAAIREGVNKAQQYLAGAPDFSKAYVDSIVKMLPEINKEIDSAIAELEPDQRMSSDLGVELANLKSQASKISTKVKDIVKANTKQITELTPVASIKGLGTLFSEQMRSAKSFGQGSQEGTAIAKDILAATEEARKSIDDLLASFGNDVPNVVKKAAKTARQQITTAEKGAKTFFGNAESAGVQTGQGFNEGLQKSIKAVKKAAKDLAESAIDSTKDALEIKSPSKVYEELGRLSAEGFLKGLESIQSSSIGHIFGSSLEELKEMIKGFSTGALSVTDFAEKLKGLATVGKVAIAAIAGLAVYNLFGREIIQQLGESLKVAAEFEALGARTNFATGSKKEGGIAFQELRSQADRFALQRQPTIEQGTSFLAVSKGTRVQGEESLKILNSLNQASRVYNLSLDQQGRAQVALQQIVSKGVVSQEELRGQLSEAIPGAAQTAARAYGVTVQELNKMVESGLDGAEFVQKFAEQLGAETASGLAGSLNTTQASIDKFQNSMLGVQESFGKALLPLQKFTLGALTTGLEIVNKILPITSLLLTVLVTKLAHFAGISLLNLVGQITLSKTAIVALGATITKVGVFVKAVLIQFAAFALVGSAVIQIKNLFSDLSGEIGKQVDQAKLLREEYQKLANVKPSQQNRPNDLQQRLSRGGIAAVEFFQGKSTFKEINDTINKIRENSRGLQETLSSAASDTTLEAIARVKIYDKELDSLQIKRRALVRSNPGDRAGLRELEKEEKEILSKRSKSTAITDNLKSQLQTQIDILKESIAFQENVLLTYPLTTEETENTRKGIEYLKEELELATNAQDRLNKAVAGGTDAFSNMRRNIKGVADDLADNTDKITIYANTQRQLLAQQINNGQIAPGEEQTRSQQINREALQKQLEQQTSAFAQSQALLSTEKFQEIMSARGINFETGRARLTTLAEGTTDPQEKYLFEQLAVLQERRLEISNLQTQISQARVDAQKQLVDLTKQVADYFRNIQRNAELQNIEMQKTSNQIRATSQQNRLRKALLDGYDNIVTTFVDAIIASIDEQRQISDRALDAQTQLINNRNQLEDTLRSGEELRRQLPRELPPVPVEITIPNASDNSDINQLKTQFDNALGITKNWSYAIGDANNQLSNSTTEANNLTNNIEDSRRSAGDTFREITNVTLGLQNSVDKAGVLSSGLSAIADKSKEVNQNFFSLPSVLGEIVQQTTNWLSQLTQAPSLLGNIAQGIQNFFTNGQGQQIGQSITNAVVNSDLGQGLARVGKDAFGIGIQTAIASPSTTQSLEQVLKGNVSKGQSFFAPRPQRGGIHSGIDFDRSEGLGGLAPFQAMFPGRVVNLRQWGKGTRDRVTGNESNAIRIASQLPGGKGTFYTDYGHYQVPTANVRQGQNIDAGTRLGVLSGNDKWSDGGHLDLKIMIPRSIAGNFKSTLPAPGGMRYVDVKEFMNWFKSQVGTVAANQSNAANNAIAPKTARLSRTGQVDKYGLERLALQVGGQTFFVNSGRRETQGMFGGAGTTRAGSKAPLEYGAYDIKKEIAGDSPAVGSKFIPIEPRFNTSRSALGFHVDADRKIAPGSAGCIVFEDEQQFQKFRELVRKTGTDKLIFENNQARFTPIDPQGNAIATLQGARQSQLPTGKYANTQNKLSPEFLKRAAEVARNLGTSPENLLAVMGFETGGTYRSDKRNPSSGATGLIGFMPQWAQKITGKTTNQLAQLSNVEQLNYVEKWINANRRGKNVSSLEDLYMSVLMPSHIGKGGNARLPGWAYRQNKGLDLNRDGAITVSEATSKVRDYYRPSAGNQVLNASNNFRSAAPGQMQGAITEGQNIARSQNEQQSALIQQQLSADLEKQKQEFLRRNNQALRQFERAGRDLRDQQLTSERTVEDLATEANKNPTYRQRQDVDIRGINRRYDDAIRERERNIQERNRQIDVSEKTLAEGGLSVEQTSALQRQLTDDKNAIAQFEKELIDLRKLRDEAIKNSEELFGREENIRRQQASFDITRGKIEQARQAIEELNVLQQKSPLDPRVRQIPALQEYVDIEETLLSAKEKELQFNEQLFKNDITPEEFKSKSEALKQETEQRLRNAKARREQAEAELNLQEMMRKSEVRSQLTQLNNEYLQTQIQLRQLGRGSGNATFMQRQIDLTSADDEFTRKRLEIQTNKNRTPEERQQLLSDLARSQEARRQLMDAQYARTTEDNAFSIQERLNQSRQELLGSRASLMRNVGGSSRDLERQAAIEQQAFSYKSALREIERFAATSDEAAQAAVQLRANLEQVNQIKLQDIKTQFDPLTDAFKSAQSGLQGFLTSAITGSESIGDAFRKMVSSLAENLANLATQLLTQELFGGLFGGNRRGNDSGGLLGGITNVLGGGQKSGGGGNWISGLLGIFGGLFNQGGVIPNFASGGAIANISQAMLKEQIATGRKPYLIVASEGERVLNHREAQMWDRLTRGGVPNFATGGVVGSPSLGTINTNNSPVSINVSVASNGDVSADAGDRGNKLANELKQSVIGIIINEQRPGGSLYGGR